MRAIKMKYCSSSSGSRKDTLRFFTMWKVPWKIIHLAGAQRQTIHNLWEIMAKIFFSLFSCQGKQHNLFTFPRCRRKLLRRYEKCVKLIDKIWWMRGNKSNRSKVCKRRIENRRNWNVAFLLLAALYSQLNKLSGVFHFFSVRYKSCKCM